MAANDYDAQARIELAESVKHLNDILTTVDQAASSVDQLVLSFNENMRFMLAWDRFLHPSADEATRTG
jgi:hypothetical protein